MTWQNLFFSSLLVSTTIVLGVSFVLPAGASAQLDTSCLVQENVLALEGRQSPLDSVTFRVAGQALKICYGRPSARERTMVGGSRVPFGKIWRTGANEPTLLRAPIALTIAGVPVPAGTYSIYTVPGESQWEIIVNRSYSQWGHERFYTDEVRAQEVGRGRVASERTDGHVETFTIRAEESQDPSRVEVILEWERTRVRVPVSAGKS